MKTSTENNSNYDIELNADDITIYRNVQTTVKDTLNQEFAQLRKLLPLETRSKVDTQLIITLRALIAYTEQKLDKVPQKLKEDT